MNMMQPSASMERILTRTEVAGLVALAARSVPPLWPLESAIAVNPLAAFEDLPFAEAVRRGAERFGARQSLPLWQWRRLIDTGKIGRDELRDAAIARLGGIYAAMAAVEPGTTALDLLMARLVEVEVDCQPERTPMLSPDAAFIAKWCCAFFDQGLAASPMPHRELGLYRAVLATADSDREYRKLTGKDGQLLLMTVPRDPLEAIAEGLAETGKQDDGLRHLEDLVARLPGWAGHIRWRVEHADSDVTQDAPASMADLLALWILIERAGCLSPRAARSVEVEAGEQLSRHFAIDPAGLEGRQAEIFQDIAAMGEGTLGSIFMQAAEWTYANSLVPQVQSAARKVPDKATPEAQLVFCIDVRSEPFRRALEAQGAYETYGYAGFFGLPIALQPFAEERKKRLLPVLLAPQHDLREGTKPRMDRQAARLAAIGERDARAARLLNAAKLGTSTAFSTAEAMGPFAAAAMTIGTLVPRAARSALSALRPNHANVFSPAVGLRGNRDHSACFSLEEKVGYAAALFRLTGLPADTARLVVLTGHGGSAVNNPYASALDCGACGGHAGGANARVLAAILNEPEVREGLAAEGIDIPQSTWFVAAEHNTTTDEVTIFDRDLIPESHRPELARLNESLAQAAQENRHRRAALLGRKADDLLTGSMHWAEIRPEWGLAGNAAFIVGSRDITRNIDLGGRAFLHSYDWRTDEDGTALTTILTAPMIVAQWINCQYLFSTLDNERYGSGDKTTQNVVGGVGVVQGNGGDLRIGLPRQSLFADDGSPFHIPQRLLAVIVAPPERVAAIVEANDILDRLFGNGWAQLVVIDPATGRAHRWREHDNARSEGSSPVAATC